MSAAGHRKPTLPTPPKAPRRAHRRSLHGRERVDDYAWLRVANWRDVMRDSRLLDAEVRAYLEAENEYTAANLRDVEALQSELFREMRGRIKEDDYSVPDADGAYAYYFRYREGGQYPVHCRRPATAPESEEIGAEEIRGEEIEGEEILLDGDAEARGRDYFQVAGFAHSPDHSLIAYAVDTAGSESYTLNVRPAAGGATLDEPIERVQGDVAWAADGRHLFYTALDENHRPWRVCRHRLGDPVARDAVVYQEQDAGFFLFLGKTRSRRFITIHASDHRTSEAWLVPADAPRAAPFLVRARERDVEYTVTERAGRLLIVTNAAGAEDYKLCVAAERRSRLRIVGRLPGGPAPRVLLERVVAFSRWIVRLERKDALPRLVVMEMDAGGRCVDEHVVAFDEECYELQPLHTFDYEGDVLRFVYTSMTTPYRVFDYDMRARTRVLRKEQIVPSGPRSRGLRDAAAVCAGARRRARAAEPALPQDDAVGRRRAAAVVRLWFLRRVGARVVFEQPPVAGGSRLCLRHGARARRHGEGVPLVQGRQNREQAQYLSRFHRLRRIPGARELHAPRTHRRARRFRRRTAGGRRRQRAPRSVRRGHRRGAVRGHAEHGVRRHPAADADRVAGVGQSDRGRRGVCAHRRVLAVRQRRTPGLPAPVRDRGPERPARDLLGSRPNGSPGCAR